MHDPKTQQAGVQVSLDIAYFDRFDICEAYYLLEVDYNVNGWLQERPSSVRRRESIGNQLHRLHFRPHANLSFRCAV